MLLVATKYLHLCLGDSIITSVHKSAESFQLSVSVSSLAIRRWPWPISSFSSWILLCCCNESRFGKLVRNPEGHFGIWVEIFVGLGFYIVKWSQAVNCTVLKLQLGLVHITQQSIRRCCNSKGMGFGSSLSLSFGFWTI